MRIKFWGVATPLSFFENFFTKLEPTLEQNLYEISTSQIALAVS